MIECQNSKNVISLIESFRQSQFTYIVTKLAEGGDLMNYLGIYEVEMLPEDWTKRIVKQIAVGLGHIHDNSIVHRDIKHMNIFFSNDSQNPRVKIADFGLASRLSDSHPYVTKRLGTVGFMAPEVALEQPSDYKADVWSLGVIIFALICSKVPF